MTYKKCNECSKEAKYVRSTQFSGDHYFCEDHAILEEGYGENDNYQVWREIMKIFKPNKFSEPVILKRTIKNNCWSVEFDGKGFCSLENLKKAIEEAENSFISRLRNVYDLFVTYSESKEDLSPESSKFSFNKEKFQDAMNVGIVSKSEELDMQYLEKEGYIELINHVRVLDPIQDVLFTFDLKKK